MKKYIILLISILAIGCSTEEPAPLTPYLFEVRTTYGVDTIPGKYTQTKRTGDAYYMYIADEEFHVVWTSPKENVIYIKQLNPKL